MNDNDIIALYRERNERAIVATAAKYGGICHGVAINILHNRQDAEECVNDTWIKAWDSIPPECPRILKAFLCRITRNLSIDRYRQNQRRAALVDMELILDELAECLPEQENSALTEALNAFFWAWSPWSVSCSWDGTGTPHLSKRSPKCTTLHPITSLCASTEPESA